MSTSSASSAVSGKLGGEDFDKFQEDEESCSSGSGSPDRKVLKKSIEVEGKSKDKKEQKDKKEKREREKESQDEGKLDQILKMSLGIQGS